MNRSMLLRLLPMLSMFALLNAYVGWHGQLWLDAVLPAFSRRVYWLAFVVLAFSYLFGRLLIGTFARVPGRALKVVGSYYFAVFEFAILLLVPADLLAIVLRVTGAYGPAYVPVAGACVCIALTCLLLWGSRNAWSPVARTYRVEVAKNAGGLSRLKVAVVSDLHLGNTVGNRHLDRLIPLVNEWEPDLVLLAGDVLDDSIEPFVRRGMADRLSRLRGKYGTYAILGNHEYYGGNIEEYVERMRRIGIPVLRDETRTIAGAVQLVGRKDKTAEAMDPAGRLPVSSLVAELDPELPILMLDHQPYGYGEAAAAGVDALISGHTHRGQFAPNHWITRRLFELDWGYLLKGNMHAFVSSGFGTWGPPIRLASRSELLRITFDFKEMTS